MKNKHGLDILSLGPYWNGVKYNSLLFGECYGVINRDSYRKLKLAKKCKLSYKFIDDNIIDVLNKPIHNKYNLKDPMELLIKIGELRFTQKILSKSSLIYGENYSYFISDIYIKLKYKGKKLKFYSFNDFYDYFGISRYQEDKEKFIKISDNILIRLKDKSDDEGKEIDDIDVKINVYGIEDEEFIYDSRKGSKINSKTINHSMSDKFARKLFQFLYWENAFKFIYGDLYNKLNTFIVYAKVSKINGKNVKISLKKFLHKIFKF